LLVVVVLVLLLEAVAVVAVTGVLFLENHLAVVDQQKHH
jgi:hypothetical protein